MAEPTILVVDDEPSTREAHAIMLEAFGSQVLQAENGVEAFTLLEQQGNRIDAIVTDILMPEMDGYQLCEKIRACGDFAALPILIVSAQDDLEEKLKGYAAGGSDYIVKPVVPDELHKKIEALLKFGRNAQQLKQMLDESTRTAMEAMHYSADLGQILEFYKNSLNAPDFKTIAELLFQVTDAYGLHGVIQIYTPGKVLTYAHNGQASPLEVNVLELARGKGRFLDFGPRTIINYDDFSILIKNMPLEDANRYGTAKDSLGNLCNAIEARIQVLLNNDAQQRKVRVLTTIQEALDEIGADFQHIQQQNLAAIDTMIGQIEESYLSLGLTEQQEEKISAITRQCLERSAENFESGIALKDRFENIQRRLLGKLG